MPLFCRFCTSIAGVARVQQGVTGTSLNTLDAVTCMAPLGNFFITGSRDGGVRWWRNHGRLECHAFIHDYRACKSAAVAEQDPETLAHLQPISLIDQTHALHMMFSLQGEAPLRRGGASIQSTGYFLISYRHYHRHYVLYATIIFTYSIMLPLI